MYIVIHINDGYEIFDPMSKTTIVIGDYSSDSNEFYVKDEHDNIIYPGIGGGTSEDIERCKNEILSAIEQDKKYVCLA